jgi:hypothetical protein
MLTVTPHATAGFRRTFRSTENHSSQVLCKPRYHARVVASMGVSSSGSSNHPFQPSASHTHQLSTMQQHLTQAQALLNPTTVYASPCTPALASAVFLSLQHPVAQATLTAVAAEQAEASHSLPTELLASLQMIPSTTPANMAASARAACTSFHTSMQMPSMRLSTYSAFTGPAFGAMQGLVLMVAAGGLYFTMLVSSFLFGSPQPVPPRRRPTRVNRYRSSANAAARRSEASPRYRLSSVPYPARRHQKPRRAPAQAKRQPLADVQPRVTARAEANFGDRVWIQPRYGKNATVNRPVAVQPYMSNLLLQSDPPPQLRRYPALRLQHRV